MPASANTVPNRSCRYCRAKFKPIREDQRFCSANHRKAFWKYGGLPFDKMKEQIMRDVRREVRQHFDELLAMIGTLQLAVGLRPFSDPIKRSKIGE